MLLILFSVVLSGVVTTKHHRIFVTGNKYSFYPLNNACLSVLANE